MFRFHLEIPLICIHTELMTYCVERDCYNYIRWFFKIWKWRFELDWGKTREERANQKRQVR